MNANEHTLEFISALDREKDRLINEYKSSREFQDAINRFIRDFPNRGVSMSKPRRNTFDPSIPASQYRQEDLERMILSYGQDEYDLYMDALNRERTRLFDEYARDQGLDPDRYANVNISALTGNARQAYENWKMQIARSRQALARSGEYRHALQNLRYNYLRNLHNMNNGNRSRNASNSNFMI